MTEAAASLSPDLLLSYLAIDDAWWKSRCDTLLEDSCRALVPLLSQSVQSWRSVYYELDRFLQEVDCKAIDGLDVLESAIRFNSESVVRYCLSIDSIVPTVASLNLSIRVYTYRMKSKLDSKSIICHLLRDGRIPLDDRCGSLQGEFCCRVGAEDVFGLWSGQQAECSNEHDLTIEVFLDYLLSSDSHLNHIKSLLDMGADPRQSNSLVIAARRGRYDVVLYLLGYVRYNLLTIRIAYEACNDSKIIALLSRHLA